MLVDTINITEGQVSLSLLYIYLREMVQKSYKKASLTMYKDESAGRTTISNGTVKNPSLVTAH